MYLNGTCRDAVSVQKTGLEQKISRYYGITGFSGSFVYKAFYNDCEWNATPSKEVNSCNYDNR